MPGTPANSLNLTTAGLVKFDGTSVFSSETTTNHAVLVGGTSNSITNVGPGTTNTVLLGNTGADPSFGTVPSGALPGSGQITLSNGTNVSVTGSPVSLGGTATINVSGPPSATTLTNHGIVIGQGSSAITATSAGSSGQVLQSGGASADPTYSTSTYPSTNAQGDLIYGSSLNALSTLAKDTNSTRYLSNTGTSNNPAWAQIDLTTGVSGTLPVGNGGTGIANPTAHDLLIGNGSSAMTQLAPSATSGIPLISQGSSSDPAYGTAVVAGGGTGAVTLTNHGVLIGQATSPIAATAAGSAGQVLQSGGASADPTYSTATYPSTAGTSGKILISDGTNIVSSTPTYPNASVTAGKVIVSDGTNYVASTPTFPNASATSGKIIISDGTNWTASTPTYPASAGTSGNILTSDGTNWTSAAPAATSGITFFLNGVTSGNPADGATYFFAPGAPFTGNTTESAAARIYFTSSMTIKKCYGVITVGGTLGSNENCTLALRLNNTTDTNVTTTLQLTGAENTFNNTGLSISVVAGDYLEFKFISPTWATNPTTVRFSASFST